MVMGEMVESTSPASFGQEQLWLVEQAFPGTSVNHTVRVWDLRGDVDTRALSAALALLVERHETLRTTLHLVNGMLSQHVEEPRPVPLELLDLDLAEDVDWDFMPLDRVRETLRVPFDLARDLMLRALLVRLGPDRNLLVLTVHHSATDGSTVGLLRSELSEAYSALAAGRSPDLPAPGTGYGAFARNEREQWARMQSSAHPWLETLRESPRWHNPLTGSRRRELVGRAGIERIELSPAGVRGLGEVAAEAGSTVTMAVLAVFTVLLSRWTGSQNVNFASPVSTRFDPDIERTVGYFVNAMPLSFSVRHNPRFADLVGEVRDAVLDGIGHAQVPPAAVQDALSAGRGDLTSPMLDVTVAVGVGDVAVFTMGDLVVTERFLHHGQTMFGLSARVNLREDGGADAILEHNADVLDARVVRRMAQHLRELVDGVSADVRVRDLAPAPAADLVALRSWSAGEQCAVGRGVVQSVAGWAERAAESVAARDEHETLTYAQLWARSGLMARRLHEFGAGREDLVAVCLPRSVSLLVALLGILRAGAGFLPLDHRDPALRITGLLTRSRSVALVSDTPSLAGDWHGPVLEVPADGASFESVQPEPDGLAYVIHTSGSTGVPKGVEVTHAGMANYLWWAIEAYGIGPGKTVPLHTSPAFDLALTSLFCPLMAGGTIDVLPEHRGPLVVADHFGEGYQLVKSTPSHLIQVMDRAVAIGASAYPRVLVPGGEKLPVDQARRWLSSAPGTLLINEYGPTETVVASTALTVRDDVSGETVAIGTPIRNTVIHVVDEDLRPVPVGVRGELVIGGVCVARGYRQAASLTAERFVPDPCTPGGGRLYRTGDLALWNADGVLEVVGRMDDQLKILGYRVEPGEVEGVLSTLPGVAEGAVVADRRDESQIRLVGFVRAVDPSGDLTAFGRSVHEALRTRLPAHLVPAQVVVLDRMPADPNGKIDRRALPLPDPVAVPSAATDSSLREMVRAAWCEVLGRAEIPPAVDFFSIGGTSLHLLQLHAELRARGVTELSVADLFRCPTVEELADRIENISAVGASA